MIQCINYFLARKCNQIKLYMFKENDLPQNKPLEMCNLGGKRHFSQNIYYNKEIKHPLGHVF